MTKLSSRVIGTSIGAGILTITLLSPQISLARGILDGGRDTASKSIDLGNNFCTRLEANTAKVIRNFDTVNEQWQERKEKQLEKIATRRENTSEKLTTVREKWETNRDENIQKLEGRATTDLERAAAATFKVTIENATKARYDAVDFARATYQKSVDTLLSDRKNAIDTAKNTLQGSLNTAIAKAKADCAQTGAKPTDIKNTLQDSVKTAQETFKNATKNLSDPRDMLKPLAQTRDQSIKKALDDFKVARDQAIAALKAAFSGTPVSTP
jgi:hypothetical protein